MVAAHAAPRTVAGAARQPRACGGMVAGGMKATRVPEVVDRFDLLEAVFGTAWRVVFAQRALAGDATNYAPAVLALSDAIDALEHALTAVDDAARAGGYP